MLQNSGVDANRVQLSALTVGRDGMTVMVAFGMGSNCKAVTTRAWIVTKTPVGDAGVVVVVVVVVVVGGEGGEGTRNTGSDTLCGAGSKSKSELSFTFTTKTHEFVLLGFEKSPSEVSRPVFPDLKVFAIESGVLQSVLSRGLMITVYLFCLM